MSIYQYDSSAYTPTPNFKPTFLYIKRHSVTGLLYFGKTVCDPEVYKGSGKYWSRHISKHGPSHVENVWYCLFTDEDMLHEVATNFSIQNNIVESDEYANLVNECGGGSNPDNNDATWIPVTIDGITYPSKKAAIRATNSTYFELNDIVANPDPSTRKKRQKKPITIDGVTYDSIKDAAIELNFPISTLRKKLLENGSITLEEIAATKPCKKPITINNITYGSYADAARQLGVPNHVIERCAKEIKEGKTPNLTYTSIPPKTGTPITVDGIIYASKADAARSLGLTRQKLKTYINGPSEKTCMRPVTIDGITYRSRREASKSLGIHIWHLDKLLKT